MRVWLYARLSNDDDPAQNSLQNQQEICRAFAEKQGWTIAGSSTDDNISGMNFSRRGLMNDYYAKDIGKKIRAGYRQKQKDGLVSTPPFGYWKDRNTNQVLVQAEAAENKPEQKTS